MYLQVIVCAYNCRTRQGCPKEHPRTTNVTHRAQRSRAVSQPLVVLGPTKASRRAFLSLISIRTFFVVSIESEFSYLSPRFRYPCCDLIIPSQVESPEDRITSHLLIHPTQITVVLRGMRESAPYLRYKAAVSQ